MDAKDREALVRRSIDAWNSEDWEERLHGLWDPDGAIIAPKRWPEPGEFRGWPAMVEQWRRLKGSWAVERVELDGLRSIGDRVVADLRWMFQGEASGAPLEVEIALLCELKDDRLARMQYFLDRDAARRAAEERP